MAIANPMPRLAPVTKTLSMPRQLSASRHRQRGNKPHERGNLVRRQPLAACLDDSGAHIIAGADALFENDIRGNERASDRVLARFHQRCAHASLHIDDGLDLFGMDLGAADVDDPVSAPDEIVPIVGALDAPISNVVFALDFAITEFASLLDARTAQLEGGEAAA